MKDKWIWVISTLLSIFFVTVWSLIGVNPDTVLVGGSIAFLVIYFGLTILNEMKALK